MADLYFVPAIIGGFGVCALVLRLVAARTRR
ncbi:hypothetical protein DFR67_106179 [Williamsia limnetica]|uniref:Uncharacterized protein n=1 Tax=Williamsia limnetica TaxID=882452 RepID=A0A318RQB9_WILLI|nr:hypothetical protein DFR67_106179 [Williamsia limnetica]